MLFNNDVAFPPHQKWVKPKPILSLLIKALAMDQMQYIQSMIEIIFILFVFISVLDLFDLSVWKVKWRMAYGVEQLEPPVLNRSQRVSKHQAGYEIRICLAAL